MEYLSEKVNRNGSEKWSIAVDVGAGSGQCTKLLQPYFDRVYGFDISEAQVNQAKNNNIYDNVEYKLKLRNRNHTQQVSPSERLPMASKSVDLITACQCLHWFDWESFFEEVHRVLKPDGVLAVIGYPMKNIQLLQTTNTHNEIDPNTLSDIYNGATLQEYFEMSRLKHLDNGYTEINFPFKDITRYQNFMDKQLTANDCLHYVQSWSGFQNCFDRDPYAATSLIENLRNKLELYLKESDLTKTELVLRSHCDLILGRK
ncbi:putative methyltransferase-like protein [Leptotrombidium deliense]|uniref:Putative methyltransferase-like protein n=1 Tax=Leptotrombidium deliense TaxID=299467 RepID=A0A443RZK5_9ACAR|nr:putative methyltransferase-like protein [Leptotrombidium deliense]